MITHLPINQILNRDCLEGMSSLPGQSIDMVITSPPYWGLRNYGDGNSKLWGGSVECSHEWDEKGNCTRCDGWQGQLGLERDFRRYISNLVIIFNGVKRVLKDAGSCWVNIGDTYFNAKGSCNNPGGNSNSIESKKKELGAFPLHRGNRSDVPYLRPKNLTLIPFHFAIAMQYKGWILRNVVIWRKPNPMPSSVKDRLTVDFEYLFFFVKSKSYYFNQPKEPVKDSSKIRYRYNMNTNRAPGSARPDESRESSNKFQNPLPEMRIKRTTWDIATKGYKGAHFAVFPEELIETPIRASCPPGGVVLDPFMGSGTTALVTLQTMRQFIGFEINPNYCKIAEDRIRDIRNQSHLADYVGRFEDV